MSIDHDEWRENCLHERRMRREAQARILEQDSRIAELEAWKDTWEKAGQPTVDKILEERDSMKQTIRELRAALELERVLREIQHVLAEGGGR